MLHLKLHQMKLQCFALAWVEETNGTQPRSFCSAMSRVLSSNCFRCTPHTYHVQEDVPACPQQRLFAILAIPLLLKALKACSPAAQSYEIGLECLTLECLTLLNDQLL